MPKQTQPINKWLQFGKARAVNKSLSYLLAIMVLLGLGACSGKQAEQTSAEKYFQQGEAYFESNLYNEAIASWEKVRDTFYSPQLSMLAELKIAESYYVTERFAEAATAYQDFLNQHPNDFRIPTVLYRLGLSYYQQIRSADRDQTATENALRAFQELVRRFPDDGNAQEAGYLIQRCKTRLAEHEVYVGWFYLRYEHYAAAINRLENILQSFPDYYYRDEAFYYLGKAYLKNQQIDKARNTFNQLFEQFPGSDYSEDARELLDEQS